MTKKELMEEIKNAPDDAEIYFSLADGCCAEYLTLDLYSVEPMEAYYPKPGEPTYYIGFYFNALDFMRSCRASGAAKRAGLAVLNSGEKK